MDTIRKAEKAVRDAESKLRTMIQEALAAQRYCEVKVLADMAEDVARILQKVSVKSPSGPVQLAAGDVRGNREPASNLAKIKPNAKTRNYPRFERDEDRLVKVGWSKKSRREYEHRVPKEVVFAFVAHLQKRVTPGTVFDVESLLPVHDASNHEVPAYQVYVAIAWLRDAGAIERKGRDGYVVRKTSVLKTGVEELWKGLAIRSV